MSELNLEEQDISQAQLIRKCYNLFAFYKSSILRNVTYLDDFYTAREEIKHIVRIHERMHAFHHCNFFGKDQSESLWVDFASVSPVYKEFLAQLFTFKCVESTYLQKYFEQLSQQQPSIYRTWTLGKSLSMQKTFDLYLKVKQVGKSEIPFLDAYAQLYTKAFEADNAQQRRPSKQIPNNLTGYERALMECIDEKKKDPMNWDCVNNKRISNAMADWMAETL